jgi:hypothetical protein
MPTCALVILTRNSFDELYFTLNKMVQILPFFSEIIISDDASDLENIREFELNKERLPCKIKMVSSATNIGTFENLKQSFKISKSDFLCFMSAGDYLDANFPVLINKLSLDVGKKIAYVPALKEFSNESDQNPVISVPRFSGFRMLDGLLLATENLSHGGGAIYPRKQVLASKVFQMETFQLMEDYLVWILLNSSGFSVHVIPHVAYFHNLNEISGTHSRSERNLGYLKKTHHLMLEFENNCVHKFLRRQYINKTESRESFLIYLYLNKAIRLIIRFLHSFTIWVFRKRVIH